MNRSMAEAPHHTARGTEAEQTGLISSMKPQRWRQQHLNTPRLRPWLFFICAILITIALLWSVDSLHLRRKPPPHINTAEDEDEQESGSKEVRSALFVENLQGRGWADMGKAARGFKRVNTAQLDSRRRNYDEFMKVHDGHCGGVTSENWEVLQKTHQEEHHPNTTVFARIDSMLYNNEARRQNRDILRMYYKNRIGFRTIQRRVCEGPHPRLKHAKVRIERLGPMFGRGGYDWHTGYNMRDVFDFNGSMKDKTMFVLGSLFTVVDENGRPLKYPPVHVHHYHLYPYSKRQRRSMVMSPEVKYGFYDRTDHNVISQAHGDTICKDEEGGLSCLLEQVPDGHGYRVVNSSYFALNFQVNDVRPAGSPRMKFYVDVAIIYTLKHQVETTFFQIGNPISGPGWSTYVYPLDPHLNLMYFQAKNRLFGSGTLNQFVLHTHMSSFDSLYVVKGAAAYQRLEAYRKAKGSVIPIILDCVEKDANKAKRDILRKVLQGPEVELFCEVAKPSLVKSCTDAGTCTYRDKRADFNCKTDVRLKKNETIVVLAFNRPRNVSNVPITRESPIDDLAIISSFGMGYSASQHTIVRANFVRKGLIKETTGDALKDVLSENYVPPSWFTFTSLPYPQHSYVSDAHRVVEKCGGRFNYSIGLPWDIPGL